jgi:hypothetical protein
MSHPEVAAIDADAADRIESRDRERSARCCSAALDHALEQLPAEDRLILQLRLKSLKVPDIAPIVGIDPKKIGRGWKSFQRLRGALEAAESAVMTSTSCWAAATRRSASVYCRIRKIRPPVLQSHRGGGDARRRPKCDERRSAHGVLS